ncbi:MAG: NAD-dependent epimerase/dehydratase family protein, partial [Candidatus Ranarchaeia archaeon]
FIGSHLAEKLILKNSVTVLDNLTSSTTRYIQPLSDKGKIVFTQGDVGDSLLVGKLLKEHDLVFHFAANPDVRDSVQNPFKNFQNNVETTLILLEQMRKHGVKEIVFASSGGTVYGDNPPLPTPESHPLSPISPYGASKAACEMYLSAYAGSYGFTAVALRYANIIGPRSNHGIIYDFFRKLSSDPSQLEILGDGKQRKSYLYIEDCVTATLLVAEAIDKGYLAVNIGTDEQITATEIAQLVISALRLPDVKLAYTGGDRGWKGDVPVMQMDYGRLFQLGWKPSYTIRDGINAYIKWLSQKN